MEYCFLLDLSFLLLVLLPWSVSEKITVTGPKQPIIALVDGEAIIPCPLSPQIDARDMDVMWFYSYFSQPVHHYKNGQDYLKYQHQDYKGRTEFLRDDISSGSVALKLHHIRLSDEGKYRCFFESPSAYEEEEFQVYVAGKGSVPHIHIESIGNKEFRLTCTSTGWYPEPEVQWRKNQEESLSQNTKITKEKNGLFFVETSIIVSTDSKVNVSCFIWNHLLNQKLETNVSLSDALSPNVPPWMVIVPVVLISTGFIIFIVIWSLKKSKGMWKDESGTVEVESGMGESETGSLLQPSAESNVTTNSLLQPSAESNVPTSMSKNATGVSKDASGVSKDAIGVIKHEPGVIKHEPGVIKLVEKKEATGVLKTAPVEKKEATVEKKEATVAPVEKKEANGVLKAAPVEKKEGTGALKAAPVEKKEATAAPVEKKEATVVLKAAPVEKKEATGALKAAPVEKKRSNRCTSGEKRRNRCVESCTSGKIRSIR